MPNILLTKKIKSIKIYPVESASKNYNTTSVDVIWGSELLLPKVHSKIGWNGIQSKPSQTDGYSGAIPLADSRGVHGEISFDIAAPAKYVSNDSDSIRIDKLLKASSTDLVEDYPYFKVTVTRIDDAEYDVICGMQILKSNKNSKKWKIVLKPNKILDTDLGISTTVLSINRLSAVALDKATVRVSFYTNKPSIGHIYYSRDGGSGLTSTASSSKGLYTHSFDILVNPEVSVVNFQVRAIADDGIGDMSSPETSIDKGRVLRPLVVGNPIYIPGAVAGQGQVAWSSNREATGTVLIGTSPDPDLVFVEEELKEIHLVDVSFDPNATKIYFQVVGVDGDNYVGRSDLQTVSVTAARPPKVSTPKIVKRTDTTLTVKFSTSKLTTAVVEYGKNRNLGNSTTSDGIPKLEHEITISGLQPDRLHFIQAVATTPAPSSKTGYSRLELFATNRPDPPKSTAVNLLNTASPDLKQFVMTTDKSCYATVEVSDTPEFFNSVKTQRSNTPTTNHNISFVINAFPQGSQLYIRAKLDIDGVVGYSTVAITQRSEVNNTTVVELLHVITEPTQARFKATLSASEQCFLSFSKYEDMSNPQAFAIQSAGTIHNLTGNTTQFGTAATVWYTVTVVDGGTSVFTTAPRSFTTMNDESPVISDVTLERKYGQQGTLIVRAKSNIPILAEVRWGSNLANITKVSRGVRKYLTEHEVEIALTPDLETGDLHFSLGGSGRKGVPNYSEFVVLHYIKSLVPLAISEVEDRNSYSKEFRQITWKTTEPASTLVKYGDDSGLNKTASLPGLRTEHSVLIDVSDKLAGEEYKFQVFSDTPDLRKEKSAEISGTKLATGAGVTNVNIIDKDQDTFKVECNTDDIGLVKLRTTITTNGNTLVESPLTLVPSTLHSVTSHTAPFVTGSGHSGTFEVRLYPTAGGSVDSATFNIDFDGTGTIRRVNQFAVRRTVPTEVNAFIATLDTSANLTTAFFNLLIDPGSPTAWIEYPDKVKVFNARIVPASDMFDKQKLGVTGLATRSGETSEKSRVGFESIAFSDTPANMRNNGLVNQSLTYDGTNVTITHNVTGGTGGRYPHLLYSDNGNRDVLDKKLVQTGNTNSPTHILNVTSYPSGTWFYFRPVIWDYVSLGGTTSSADLLVGELMVWRKP